MLKHIAAWLLKGPEKEKSRENLLLEEYKGLIPQIIHWDSHFWNKSKFFLIFESAFLGGTLIALRESVVVEEVFPFPLFIALIGVVALNLYLSYVWFRTNRRNREFLELRFRRAREVEAELGSVQKLFRNDLQLLSSAHSSARWEIHLATGFAVVWVAVFCGLIVLYGC